MNAGRSPRQKNPYELSQASVTRVSSSSSSSSWNPTFAWDGSVQEVINSTYIERIPIPVTLLERDFVSELNQKVKTLSAFFDTAYLKEEEAIKLVENEIESWQKS